MDSHLGKLQIELFKPIKKLAPPQKGVREGE
jgi:hypothetical protein